MIGVEAYGLAVGVLLRRARRSRSTVVRLWVPLTHSQLARHWNWAASGASVSAWRAPSRAATFTPLSTVGLSVVVMVVSLVRAPC